MIDSKEKFKLYFETFPKNELLGLLLSFFGKQTFGDNSIIYTQEGAVLEIAFSKRSKKQKVAKIKGNLGDADFKKIELAVEEALIENQNKRIAQRVLFTHEGVDRYFRYKDLFQIRPIHRDAPKPEYRMGDFPFVLEYEYTSSTNASVNAQRSVKVYQDYILILNSLSRLGIFDYRDQGLFWTTNCFNVSEVPESKLMSKGYHSKHEALIDLDCYSDTGQMIPIGLVKVKEYYDKGRYRYPSSFEFPDTIDDSLDRIFSLKERKPEVYEQFMRSAYWLSVSDKVYGESPSLSCFSLINAIECLLDNKSEKCDCCGQIKYAPTRKFNEFINKFVRTDSEGMKVIKEMYEKRSRIVHGGPYLPLGNFNLLYTLEYGDAERLFGFTNLVVRRVIYNWLHGLEM